MREKIAEYFAICFQNPARALTEQIEMLECRDAEQFAGINCCGAVKIIQATEGSIKMIWLDKGNQESEEQIGVLVRAITQHCSEDRKSVV